MSHSVSFAQCLKFFFLVKNHRKELKFGVGIVTYLTDKHYFST
jgi:hypothetical protein